MSFRAIPHEDEIYRFRSVDALIGDHKELYRQTCYLARPDQLNDAAEDTVNVVWQGDAILWPNLVSYYWRSLAASKYTGYVFLPGYHWLLQESLLDRLLESAETDASSFREACGAQYNQVLDDLNQREQAVSGFELQTLLSKLTPPALRRTDPLLETNPLRDFPRKFVQAMGKLLLSEWGLACFTKDFENPYLWSAYADQHRGVCLVFDRKALQGLEPPEQTAEVELDEVRYEMTKPEIEFFTNVPMLTGLEYERLFSDENGVPSPLCPFLPMNDDRRQQAWLRRRESSRENLLTKHLPWQAEQEVRMFCRFDLGGIMSAEPSRHTVQYPLRALKGIIFGERTEDEAKQDILEVILAKHYVSPVQNEFWFSQAEMQPDGSIHRRPYGPYVTWQHKFTYPKKGRWP